MPSSTSFNNNDEPWRKLLFKQVESIKSLFILLFYPTYLINQPTNQHLIVSEVENKCLFG